MLPLLRIVSRLIVDLAGLAGTRLRSPDIVWCGISDLGTAICSRTRPALVVCVVVSIVQEHCRM